MVSNQAVIRCCALMVLVDSEVELELEVEVGVEWMCPKRSFWAKTLPEE